MKPLQLTPIEQNELTLIISLFKKNFNKESSAIKTDRLLFHLRASGSVLMSGQTFRKYMGHIRKNDLAAPGFIVSTVNAGYWYTENKYEQQDFLNRELNRMGNQFSNVEALRNRLMKKQKVVTGQITFF